MEEIWKDLPYCNYYQVSNFGNVRAISRPIKTSRGNLFRMSKPKKVALTDNGSGYKIFGTRLNSKDKNFYIHRIVAELFIPNPKNLKEVNHIDGDKSNNGASNLEWASRIDNVNHAVKNNLVAHGEGNGLNVLTKEQVLEILAIAHKNPKINRTELGRIYGVVDTAICRIISGKRWRRVKEEFNSRLAKDETI